MSRYKDCSDCLKSLPIMQFNRCGKSRTGKVSYRPYCKGCEKDRAKGYKRARSKRNNRFFDYHNYPVWLEPTCV